MCWIPDYETTQNHAYFDEMIAYIPVATFFNIDI